MVDIKKLKILDLFSGIKKDPVLLGCNAFYQGGRDKLDIIAKLFQVSYFAQSAKRHSACVLVCGQYPKPCLHHTIRSFWAFLGVACKTALGFHLRQAFSLSCHNKTSFCFFSYLRASPKILIWSLLRFGLSTQKSNAVGFARLAQGKNESHIACSACHRSAYGFPLASYNSGHSLESNIDDLLLLRRTLSRNGYSV